MATQNTIRQHGDSQVIVWENITKDSDGVALDCTLLNPLTVSFEGTFGLNAEVMLEGSVGGEFFIIETPYGGVISSYSSGIESIYGRYLSIRPRVINGTSETNITVFLYCDTIKKRRSGK